MANTSNAIDVIDLEEKEQPANAWDYFKKIDKDYARCLLCGKKLTTKNRSITGLKNHLSSIHKLSNFCEQSKKKQERQIDTVFRKCTTVEPKLTQSKIDKFDGAAVEAIIIDGRSFSDFEKDGMVKFLAVARPGYKGLSRKKARDLIHKKYTEKQVELQKRLENVESMSLTTDIWSSRNRMSFMVVTGHFIEKEVLRSIILSFFEFSDKHTAYNIQKKISDSLSDNCFSGNLVSVTTDNGANVKKACSELLPSAYNGVKWIPCLANTLHLVLCNSLGLWSASSFEDPDTGNLNDIVDPWGENLSSSDSIHFLSTSLKKLRDCLLVFSRSNKMVYCLRQKMNGSKLPQLDCRTRWNSTYEMIADYLRCHNEVVSILLDNFSDSRSIIEPGELEALESLAQVMKPFKNASDLISGSKYSTISLGIIIIKALSEACAKTSEDCPMKSTIKDKLSKGITKYFYDSEGNLKMNFSVYMLAAFIDPLCHDALTADEKTQCEKELRVKIDKKSDKISNCDQQSSSQKRASINRLLHSVGLEISSNAKKMNEIEHMKTLFTVRSDNEEEQSATTFWSNNSKSMPNLSKLALELLHCQLTSVPSESAFSISGNLISARRGRLSGETVEEIMFLKDKFN